MRTFLTFALALLLLSSAYPQTKTVTLDDIFRDNTFRSKSVYGIRSMKDGEHYTTLEEGRHIVKYAYQTGKAVDTLLSLRWSGQYSISRIADYDLSNDERQVLISTNTQSIYRHSFLADFYVWNISSRGMTPVSGNGAQQLATFSPDGSKIAFVRGNNLYVQVMGGEEFAVTSDGILNEIINGAPDWVYEEEFGFSKAFAWSPDSRRIAWIRFDEREVPMFKMDEYGDLLYPDWYSFKYPKAGEKNSVVSVHIYDMQNRDTKKVDIGTDREQYIPRIKWTTDPERLCAVRLNRLQNRADLLLADAATGNTRLLYSETNKYYISEPDDHLVNFTPDGKYFYLFSERSGYNHIYLHDMKTGKEVRAITSGNYDVAGLLGYHPDAKRFYYIAADESPLRRNVYSVGIDGKKPVKISVRPGMNSAVFSSSYKYFINYYSNANTPLQVELYNAKGKLVRMLEDNVELAAKNKEYGFVRKELMTIETQSGVQMNAYMLKPADMQPGKRYPLFMFVYGGPGSQQVLDGWDGGMPWKQMLVQKGYIVACVDNRGTGLRGEEFRKCTYMQLGKLETQDQVEAAMYFGRLPYVDAARIGIFGWSYGGYMSSLCLTAGADVFKLGIAVAPVTSWRFYDTVYTERYMRTPQENPGGYDDNSPINHAAKLKGKFLLIHGSADDNVHFQNTMAFTEKLVQAGRQFEMQVYPDKNHGIYGGNTTMHLYTRMTDYILNNL
jgi:dipeptidyl-peptidase-4